MPKYTDITTIPAQVFFNILQTKNYQLLKPKPSEKDLEKVFSAIYDDFFIKSDNQQSKRYLDLTNNVAFLKYKIATIKAALHFCYYNQHNLTKEMINQHFDALIDGCGIYIDKENNFDKEILRILNIEIGIIQNDLSMDELELKAMVEKNKGKGFDYYDQIGVLSDILPNNALLKEEMTLATYITLEKLANKKIDKNGK